MLSLFSGNYSLTFDIAMMFLIKVDSWHASLDMEIEENILSPCHGSFIYLLNFSGYSGKRMSFCF